MVSGRILWAACLIGIGMGVESLQKRGALPADQIKGLPETVPTNSSMGSLYLKHKPYLKIVNGCVPYSAVDAQGNTK
jgi:hypothetical protein